jgi:hypothetical protein
MPLTSTQQFLEIDQVKEGIMVLRNKALRGILMVTSINFALKSDDEQTAIIYQFQNFLNSLDFSLEVFIQSRKLNIASYLDKLKDLEMKQSSDLLRIQTTEYRKFITELISNGSIMNKTFYVIVPFVLFNLMGLPKSKDAAKSASEEHFQRAKSQLWQRMEFVALGLRRCGLQCVPLNSLEIIEFLWSLYHPQ